MRYAAPTPVALCLLCFVSEGACDSLSYELRTVARTSIHVVTVNLNDRSLRLDLSLAKGLPKGDEPFSSLIAKMNPLAAINGTFFSKQSLKPTGDLVKDGKLISFGGMGTAMAADPDNNVSFQRVDWGRQMDWSNYETVLACGPSLILRGHANIDPEIEGFADDHVLNPGTRSAVGVDQWKRLKLVCVTTPITLSRLSAIMQQLGCTDAMNLDGGASTALYYRGKTLVAPQRKLTNLLIVRRRTPLSPAAPVKHPNQAATTVGQGPHPDQTQPGPSSLEAERQGSRPLPAQRSPENPPTATTPAPSTPALPEESKDAKEEGPKPPADLTIPSPSVPTENKEQVSTAERATPPPELTRQPPPAGASVTILNTPVPARTIGVAATALALVLAVSVLLATRELSVPRPMKLGARMAAYLAALPLIWFVGMAVFSVVHDLLSGGSRLLTRPEDLALASVVIAVLALVSLLFGPKDITNCVELGMWTALAVGVACYANGRLHYLDWQFHMSGWRLVAAPIPSGLIMGGLVGYLKRRIARRSTFGLSL